MRASDLDQIRELPLFREMAAAHFDALTKVALLQKFPEHVTLVREAELPDFLHVLVEGAVELFASWDERETTLDILRPTTTFILAAVIRDEVHLKSARTVLPSRVLMIPAQSVRDVFVGDAAFARAVVNELAHRYRSMVRILKDRKLCSATERLANWILEEERRQNGHGRVVLTHDKRTLSALLGMTPENLSRSLAGLSVHGVKGRRREIVISDRDALQRRAKPSLLIDR